MAPELGGSPTFCLACVGLRRSLSQVMSLNHRGSHLTQQREGLAGEQPDVSREVLGRSSVLPILNVWLILLPGPFSGRSCLSGSPESPQLLDSAFREGERMLCRRQT